MNRYVSQLGKVLVLAVTSLLLVGNAFAQSTTAVDAKGNVKLQKAELAFALQNPTSLGGLGGFNFNTFEFHVGGANLTSQVLALLGGRGSQLYINPTGTTMVGYVAGTFTGIPFANAPVMAKACLLTGPCFSNTRLLRSASGYPSTTNTTNTLNVPAGVIGATWNTFGLTAFPFTVTSGAVITELGGVGNSGVVPMTGQWQNHYPFINIWRAGTGTTVQQEFDLSPTMGNFVGRMPLTQNNQPFGAHHFVRYTPQNQIALPAGNYWISVFHQIVGGAGTEWGFRQSLANISIDHFKNGFMAQSAPISNYGVTPPNIAVDVEGYGG